MFCRHAFILVFTCLQFQLRQRHRKVYHRRLLNPDAVANGPVEAAQDVDKVRMARLAEVLATSEVSESSSKSNAKSGASKIATALDS
jgi:hypothetical protein